MLASKVLSLRLCHLNEQRCTKVQLHRPTDDKVLADASTIAWGLPCSASEQAGAPMFGGILGERSLTWATMSAVQIGHFARLESLRTIRRSRGGGLVEPFTAQMQSCEVPAPLLTITLSIAKAATPRRHQYT